MKYSYLLPLVVFATAASAYTSLYNLKTGSMPCFQNDSALAINTLAPFGSLQVGDTICYNAYSKRDALRPYLETSPAARFFYDFFSRTDKYICHRIVYMNASRMEVVVKADISIAPDPFIIGPKEYYGKVVSQKCENKGDG